MDAGLQSFVIFLSILWFFVYWILGGVFFAVMAILRLGRVRKVRFSCLFSLLAAVSAVGASYIGVKNAESSILQCLGEAGGHVQTKMAIISCGFSGIMQAFAMGAGILAIGGFLIMAISKSKAKPWIHLDDEEEEKVQTQQSGESSAVPVRKSKFF